MLFAGGPVKSDSEIIYKEVIEDGKTITRQFKFLHYYEYNSDGKKIYEKRSKDIPERDVWYTYDEKGRLISTSSGVTYTYDENGNNTRYSLSKNNFITYEYDLNGNKIHEKRSRDGVENWYEYDKAGNQILRKISNGTEIYSEYDSKGKAKMTSDIMMGIKIFQAHHKLPTTGNVDFETLKKLKTYSKCFKEKLKSI